VSVPATAPVKEIGYASTATSYNWTVEGETTPELQWPQSVEVYDAMRRTDSQVKSVLQAVMLPVRATPWRIDPAGARAEVVELVADDMNLPIKGQNPKVLPRTRDRFSWADHLRLALLMLPFGFSFFEQTYRVDDDGLRAHLAKLGQRPARTIMSVDVARDGGLISITQYGTINNDGPQRPIPVDRLVAYVHEREGGNWLGQSILRPAYKNWLLKDRLLRVQAQTVERNGMGVPVYEGQEGASAEDLEVGKSMATSLRAGEAAGAATPFGAKLRLMGVEGTLPDAQPAVEYHDSQIARAVLAHFLNLGTQTGSWALGTTFADFFTLSLQTLAQQIADVATQHIIEDLVDINFGPDEPAPRLTFDEIGSRQAATAQALKSLVDAGVIHPDEVLEESSRQQYGLPPADPSTTTVPALDPSHDGTPPPSDPSVRPGSVAAAGDAGPKGPAATAAPDPGDDDDFTEAEALAALIRALAEYAGEVRAAWDPSLHPRDKDGRFRSLVSRIVEAITDHHDHGGNGDPFTGFNREQLRKAAKARGIDLKRGESRESIAAKLLADVEPSKKSVPTWDELGKPQGPSPIGVPIGHEGGTYERMPGDLRRYRVVTSDGRDISDQVSTSPSHHQTAEDARIALRMDALDQQRVRQAHDSGAVDVWNAVPGSWSYGDREIQGFHGASTGERRLIRTALDRWTGHKSSTDSETRAAEPTVNAALRGAVPFDADILADVAALDRALELSRTTKAITVYRGVTNGEHILPDDWLARDLTGLEWSTSGFTPTTGNIEAAEAYVGAEENRGFMMRLKRRKGSSAVAVRDLVGGLDDEGEIILPRGMTFRVVKDNGPQGELGLRQLDVEIVSRDPGPPISNELLSDEWRELMRLFRAARAPGTS
jgi:hypothetical protein